MGKIYTVVWVLNGQPGALADGDFEVTDRRLREMVSQGATTFWHEDDYEGEIEAISEKPIILLDLNFTLVANSRDTFDVKRGPDVTREIYRNWLVELIRDHYVILITVRTTDYEASTLASIAAKTGGWQPQEWYFKPVTDRFMKAPAFKERVLRHHVFPKHGARPMAYLALESNEETRAMYADYNIMAAPVPWQKVWDRLPVVVRQSGGKKARPSP
jgi:hypothetical protein